ncbi:Predicted transcriptional regulator, contains HTH domain [Mucilaginibacter lappiensis]|uniref:HTH transcriptional regulator n=1 Tax=Mucilaginibacter lappiensis TaxID=354630 RepID=A0ABR6PM48_9SPHI|nr:ATP-binding protein [Mucilaginibacter lappiensis]MBB6110294.1 putative HTH transcriptional regulator [Mucilaginibacter lappiensis]SIR29479.1 Predicted transcriptional regulator, contains HTH domain [Mucilaginibacter lappiensis]
MKVWVQKAKEYLDHSLGKVPQELNELDWKETLSPKNEKLCQHICAFSNLPGGGYMIFGIEDKTATPKGINQTDANAIVSKLSSLCRDGVDPLISIDHSIEEFRGVQLLFIHIKESSVKPVHLATKTIEDSYIRSGGSTRKASRQEIGGLMLNSKTPVFEELNASKLKNEVEIMTLLDYATIYRLLKKPIPSNIPEIMLWLKEEKMIVEVDGNGYYISNFGALAAAQNLNEFDGLSRKSIRVIKYEGKSKSAGSKEYPGNKGYAIGFEGLIQFIKSLLPGSEIIKHALREETSVYPEIALREIIANALIHQDFSIRGSGPMIEVFEDRIEISSPGRLLPSKKIDRLIRTSPESRNEILAAAFRRYNICEERGSGFEKSVRAVEFYGLPPIKFTETENSFKVTMYSPKRFADMSLQERIEACYQHAVVQYYANEGMTNGSLRQRFGMHDKQVSQISRLIKEAIDAGRIKSKDPDNDSKKFTIYWPYWA